MVGELYDYVISIVVVGIIFISGVLAVPAISYLNLRHVDEQQLRNTALNVFNTMLLSTGSPRAWGSAYPFEQDDVEFFGLSKAGQPSLFVLDLDKVQRLDVESPWNLTYERVRELLGLSQYGFSLSIFRPFQVEPDITIVGTQVFFAVNVSRNEDGRPIPNAQVSVTILATAKKANTDDPLAIVNDARIFLTDALGRCEGNQTIELPQDYEINQAVGVMKITVAGISTLVTVQAGVNLQDVMKISTFGDTVTLTFRGWTQDLPEGARRIKQIDAYDFDQLTRVWDGSDDPSENKINQGEGDFQFWNMTFPGLQAMDHALLLFTVSLPLPGEGTTLVIITGPLASWDSERILQFGQSEEGSTTALKLRRFVVLSGMTYVAELTLWEEG